VGDARRSAKWHFLGAVQRNKIGRLAPYVDCWQSVARVVEGAAIERHRSELPCAPDGRAGPPASLLVEVETTGLAGREDARRNRCRASSPACAPPGAMWTGS